MRIIIIMKEEKATGRIAAMARQDGSSKDTKRETVAGERMFALITAFLAQLEGEAKAAGETPVKKPGRLKRLVAWAKEWLGAPITVE